MFTPPGLGYDRAITIFSPDGRLFQVEYALEAVRRGWTALGIRCVDGVVLAVEKKKISPLIDPSSMEKILKIDDHVGATFAGLSSDARILIDRARQEAQINRLLYDDIIDVEVLTKKVSEVKQLYTQHAGVRPFGVALLIAGVDKFGPRLFMTEPSGAYAGYFAVAIGAGSQTVTEFFEKNYDFNMTLDSAIPLALKALATVVEGGMDPTRIEMAIIRKDTGKFELIPSDVLQKYIAQVKAGENA
ncbi:MAG: archaeal proteasome endopeptidase complex subunit alpha [Candidatus Methanomethylicia archaeon]|jgi:proteasome alpha subunit|nr:archaeal proteasome endopeptidase complex subunit alpha [Candidatus Methanomethylicia archaeon]MCQ5373952.1 archaeal proteasome endopeptidase complex subunit alpha [Candidatus Methanomethylicia archaeon]NHV60192.1 archaeal proteasome endopeptidase complex subunit alpha [Candidatus Verstraetearchaeota archaeon]